MAAVLALSLSAGVARAGLFPDPVETGYLNAIATILTETYDFIIDSYMKIQKKIHTRLTYYAFPIALFRQIKQAAVRVSGLREELEALSCVWQGSLRTNILKGMYLRPLKLCKPSFQAVWGSSDAFWDAEVQGLNDYASSLTANMISQRVEDERSWVRVFVGQAEASALTRLSPGEGLRDAAANVAWLNELSLMNSQIDNQVLLTKELRFADKRMRQRKSQDAAYWMLSALAGVDPWRQTGDVLSGGRADALSGDAR